jgi:rare lipoprotein A
MRSVGHTSVAYQGMTDQDLSRETFARRVFPAATVAGIALLLANCAGDPGRQQRQLSAQNAREIGAFSDARKYGRASPRVANYGDAIPSGGGRDHVGRPYRVAGRVFTPRENPNYSVVGSASWYGDAFHGRKTANGEVYNKYAYTAAHPTLPLPSYLRVTNMSNGRSIIVRANDRGPFHGNRIIDVSERVATALEFKHIGTARVKVDFVRRAGLAGSDDRRLVATLRTDGAPAQLDGITGPGGGVMVAGNDQRAPLFATPVNEPRHAARPAAPPASVPGVEPAVAAVQVAEAPPVARAVPRPPERPFDLGGRAPEITARAPARTVALAESRPLPQPLPAALPQAVSLPLAAASPTLAFAPSDGGARRSAVPIHGAQMAALYYAPASDIREALGRDDPTRRIRPGMTASRDSAGDRTVAVGLFRDPANAARLQRALADAGDLRASRVTVAGEVLTRVQVHGLSEDAARGVIERARRAGASDARLVGR